ncbi:hypothetical protein MHM84_09125 [Halomonas sp. McH1-25]|uniref:hypothetical protein n=1 Tax=unclassified Halomonas TaxID=2609666 RepID=UPI001EF47B3D|nr:MULTISPECIES: hypothetical protein [unclassified Halomonas]MCG7599949.1 hypothetical protein [Halomonas sp. McH1-25]MCP1342640.1 hypothetical protein [Halomonas sp. FL8]MCP1363356.1 hypothetical protein [Halomonas sp. BBD45]MCP1363851.1 hypothetical protein [Halomonas sp. BBD48]
MKRKSTVSRRHRPTQPQIDIDRKACDRQTYVKLGASQRGANALTDAFSHTEPLSGVEGIY